MRITNLHESSRIQILIREDSSTLCRFVIFLKGIYETGEQTKERTDDDLSSEGRARLQRQRRDRPRGTEIVAPAGLENLQDLHRRETPAHRLGMLLSVEESPRPTDRQPVPVLSKGFPRRGGRGAIGIFGMVDAQRLQSRADPLSHRRDARRPR